MTVVLSSKSVRRNKKLDKDAALIEKSLKRFKITAEAESEWRKQGLEDARFSIGTGQWDEAVKANREIEGKPCLTVNRAPAFLRQYTGEERQHRPAMIVSPVGDGADMEVAKLHQGVLRHIEVASSADFTYDHSYEWMMRIGGCPWRIACEYVSETSFAQEPRIVPIENPFSAYLSPIRKPDGSDPLWAHVIEDMGKEEYEEKFGKDSELAKLRFPTEMGDAAPGWVTKSGARIAEYWWLELTREVLCELPDGSTILEKDIKDPIIRRTVEAKRDTIIRKVCCVKHNAIEVLAKYDYLGKYIPLPEVNGVRLNINGQIYKAGMVRDYRDAQRIYDFMVTRQVEHVDLYSKDPLWVPEGNANHEEEYRNSNRKNYSHLYYKPYDDQGRQLQPPMRLGRDVPIDSMSKIIQQADYDMKAVIGIYGPGLGEEGPVNESAFAVLTREEKTDAGSVNWHDNLNRAIRYQGKILLDLWPKLIDTERLQRIINPDDSVKHAVVFNSQMGGSPDAAQAMLNPEIGLKKAYDVGIGDYDVVLSSGPMYLTARKESFKALSVVISQQPELFPILGYFWARNADFADSDQLAKILKKLQPPQFQDADDDDPQAKLAAAQAQLQQLTVQQQQLIAELARATDTIRTDRLSIESKERISALNNQTQILIQQLKDHGQGANLQLEHVLNAITLRLEALHASMSVDQEAGAAPPTPELPSKVEPKVLPVAPTAPTVPVAGTTG